MNKLEKARVQIDKIDREMQDLFIERMHAVEEVVNFKIASGKEVLDRSREQKLIEKNLGYLSEEKYKKEYESFLKSMLMISKDYQRSIINKEKIGYSGTYGAFAYIASNHIFPQHEYVAFDTFEDVVKAVEQGEITYGVIPYENSYTGEVGEVSDLMYSHNVYINQMYDLKVDQNLLGIKGTKTSKIKKVYSHPQGLSQCSLFLKGRDIELVSYMNTALAAQYVSELQDLSVAAIASKETAELFGLDILEENIQTTADNTTRFAVIQRENKQAGNHFQMLFATKNEAGALARAMNLIASYGFSMESIKSRAIPSQPWAYYFHVEIEGTLLDKTTQKMLKELNELCEEMKILGSYYKQEEY